MFLKWSKERRWFSLKVFLFNFRIKLKCFHLLSAPKQCSVHRPFQMTEKSGDSDYQAVNRRLICQPFTCWVTELYWWHFFWLLSWLHYQVICQSQDRRKFPSVADFSTVHTTLAANFHYHRLSLSSRRTAIWVLASVHMCGYACESASHSEDSFHGQTEWYYKHQSIKEPRWRRRKKGDNCNTVTDWQFNECAHVCWLTDAEQCS